jgi:ABC-type bacteriocin/lantibiotic exporter with double-glycine peptidase domain
MKKALMSGALGLTVLGAAALPAQSAFGNASQRQAQRCAALVQTIQLLRTERATATDPNVLAAINRAGQKVVNKATRLGCTIPPP